MSNANFPGKLGAIKTFRRFLCARPCLHASNSQIVSCLIFERLYFSSGPGGVGGEGSNKLATASEWNLFILRLYLKNVRANSKFWLSSPTHARKLQILVVVLTLISHPTASRTAEKLWLQARFNMLHFRFRFSLTQCRSPGHQPSDETTLQSFISVLRR
jgi:hypothetical protein